MFLKEVSYIHQGIDTNKNCNISGNILQFKISVYILTYYFYNLFMQSWIFSSHNSNLHSHMIIQKSCLYADLVFKNIS